MVLIVLGSVFVYLVIGNLLARKRALKLWRDAKQSSKRNFYHSPFYYRNNDVRYRFVIRMMVYIFMWPLVFVGRGLVMPWFNFMRSPIVNNERRVAELESTAQFWAGEAKNREYTQQMRDTARELAKTTTELARKEADG